MAQEVPTMPRNAILATLLLAAALAACGTTAEEPAAPPTETSSAAELRRIELTEGATFSYSVDPQGSTSITIVVPEGRPDAGTYTSTSPHLLDEVRTIRDTLGQPGVRASMEVDDRNEILSVSHGVTKQ